MMFYYSKNRKTMSSSKLLVINTTTILTRASVHITPDIPVHLISSLCVQIYRVAVSISGITQVILVPSTRVRLITRIKRVDVG